jgi:hypothetical protein
MREVQLGRVPRSGTLDESSFYDLGHIDAKTVMSTRRRVVIQVTIKGC